MIPKSSWRAGACGPAGDGMPFRNPKFLGPGLEPVPIELIAPGTWSYKRGANSPRNLLLFYMEIPFFNPSKGKKVSQAVSLCPVPCLGVAKQRFGGELNSQRGKGQGLSDSGDRDGPWPQNSGRNSSNHIPELGHSQWTRMGASNTRILSSSPHSHHSQERISLFYPCFC